VNRRVYGCERLQSLLKPGARRVRAALARPGRAYAPVRAEVPTRLALGFRGTRRWSGVGNHHDEPPAALHRAACPAAP